MSWDSYIDNLLGHAGGHCDRAGIIGLDGSLWTTHGHASALKLSPDESATIAKCLNSEDFAPFKAVGIKAEGVKYIFFRADGNRVLGKKKDNGAITLQKSKTGIVIGHTAEGQAQGHVNKGVKLIAEYLESLGM